MTKLTGGVAVVGVSSAWWPPSLADVAGVAGHLVPILSAAFLAVQLVRFCWAWWKEAGRA